MFVIGLLGFALVAGSFFALSRVSLPQAAPLPQTTFIYDDAGHQLTSYQVQNRVNVPYKAVPPILVHAVVSTEDRHFFTEGAINPVSIIRALISNLRGNTLQGGSTITQQYVKQTYLNSQRTVTRKIREAAIAVKLAHSETKDQILDSYLNTIYLGRGAYGVQAASEAYFGKPVGQDGLPEASLLAGLIREPENADPAHDAALARAHQTDTLNALIRDHQITSTQARQVEATPFGRYVLPQAAASTAGDESLPGDAYFLDAVHQQLVATYGAAMVDTGGLRVTTTLDPTLQTDGYNAVYGTNRAALDPSKGDPAAALVSLDDTGAVKVMIGGKGYDGGYPGAQVNLALGTEGGGSGRQAGSTFKAFMLAYLVKAGYSVQSTFPAPPEVVVPHGNANGTPWSVTNFEGEAAGLNTSLIAATAQSINTVYAQVVEKLGAQNLDAMAAALGIDPKELVGAYPSQVLGTADVSPLEMTAAYATFADRGVYNSPILFTKVTRADGKPLPLPVHTTRRALTAPQADIVSYVLQQVVLYGTGGAARGVGNSIAGKTGTTDNSANAWFIGYTPKLTTGIWMGYPQGNQPMVNFRGLKSVQGGDTPAQLWRTYMAAAIRAEPGYKGSFTPAYNLAGTTLTPPAPGVLQFPQGLVATTTTLPSQAITTTTTTPTTTATTPTSRGQTSTVTTAPSG